MRDFVGFFKDYSDVLPKSLLAEELEINEERFKVMQEIVTLHKDDFSMVSMHTDTVKRVFDPKNPKFSHSLYLCYPHMVFEACCSFQVGARVFLMCRVTFKNSGFFFEFSSRILEMSTTFSVMNLRFLNYWPRSCGEQWYA